MGANIRGNDEVSILLVGIGGYGGNYIKALFDDARAGPYKPFKVAGAVDVDGPARGVAASYGVPFYETIDAFYAENGADLAIISTPIYLHCEQTLACLARGSNVLCEKPLCASIDDARKIERAEAAAGKFVRVGYQLSFSRAVLALKADIAGGLFGKPLMFKTIVHYPRDEAYYARNGWAGRRRMPDGRLTLDSPLHNAVSHHINNMLFLLGDAPDRAAEPASVQAELYRGNPDADNFDTAALRCATRGGADMLFYTSHALAREGNYGPVCQFRFERATVVHSDEREHETFTALFDDGASKRYAPRAPDQMQKLWDCIAASRGGPTPPSSAAAAAAEVLCVNGAQLSHPITTIPGEYVRRIGEPGRRHTQVDGLENLLERCYDAMLLPSETCADCRPPWVSPGKIVAADEITNINDKL